ncbi:hypothetical protein C0Q70_10005 [Pomacea canaliculata]|uniref:Uncharacterized protein n=1 Tax=Pomacea canaliculata TaxID=400727 RepID=A0A2T7PBD5_POMCA|nr:hypothetical protein C0Q70_10005 [Pomacea canaliculata]
MTRTHDLKGQGDSTPNTQEEDSKTSISSQHLKKDFSLCDCLLPLVSGTMLQMNVAAMLLLLLAAARCCDSAPANHQEHDEEAEEKEHEELDEEVHHMHGMNKCRGGCPPDVDCEFSVTLPEKKNQVHPSPSLLKPMNVRASDACPQTAPPPSGRQATAATCVCNVYKGRQRRSDDVFDDVDDDNTVN